MICWRGIKIDDHNYAQAKLHFKSSSSYSICWSAHVHTHTHTKSNIKSSHTYRDPVTPTHTLNTPMPATNLVEGGTDLSWHHIISGGSCKVHRQAWNSYSLVPLSAYLSTFPHGFCLHLPFYSFFIFLFAVLILSFSTYHCSFTTYFFSLSYCFSCLLFLLYFPYLPFMFVFICLFLTPLCYSIVFLPVSLCAPVSSTFLPPASIVLK